MVFMLYVLAFNNGFIICWGVHQGTGSYGHTILNFPVTFTNYPIVLAPIQWVFDDYWFRSSTVAVTTCALTDIVGGASNITLTSCIIQSLSNHRYLIFGF